MGAFAKKILYCEGVCKKNSYIVHTLKVIDYPDNQLQSTLAKCETLPKCCDTKATFTIYFSFFTF